MSVNIFEYIDYRKFLDDTIRQKLISRRGLSLRALAKRAGFSSPGYCKMLIQNKRNLSVHSARRLAAALGLTNMSAEYFEHLVEFNQAKSFTNRKLSLATMHSIIQNLKTSHTSQIFAVEQTWYNLAILELGSCHNFTLTPETVYGALQGVVNLEQIKSSFLFLIDHGFLQKKRKNYFVIQNSTLKTADEVMSVYVQEIHKQTTQLARQALKLPLEQREFQCITLALSQERFRHLKKRIKEICHEIATHYSYDKLATDVYHINMQAYPITQTQSIIKKPSQAKDVVR